MIANSENNYMQWSHDEKFAALVWERLKPGMNALQLAKAMGIEYGGLFLHNIRTAIYR
jgi:hypothetical protein